MTFPRPTHPLHRLCRATCFAIAGLLTLSSADAQPSGKYGPTERNYELPAAERIYFVAPDGNADAPGTSIKKPTTLESAIARVVTGDAIVLRGGTYRTGSLVFNQGITIQPYADEKPVLKGTQVATDWEQLPNGLWRTRWTRLFPAEPADWWRREWNSQRTPVYLFNNDMVFIDGQLLDTVGGPDEMHERACYIDYENGFVHIGANPDGRLVEITAHNKALYRTIRDVHGKQNDGKGPTVRGITLTQYARLALEVEGTEPGAYMDPSNFGKEVTGATFEDLTISHCSRVAGYFRGDGLVIRNCLISHCGTEGLYVVNSADIILEGNIVEHTNSSEKLTGYYASAIKIFNQSYRAVCRNNLIRNNPHSSGIWYDVGNVDGVVINNRFENTRDGFFFEISKGAICAGNVFVNCSPGIRILNSSDVQVYQNTFHNSQAEFSRSARSSEAGDHFGWHASSGPGVEEREGHVFVNNLLIADGDFDGPLVEFSQQAQLRERMTEPHVKEMDGNVYLRRVHHWRQPLITWSPAANEAGSEEFFSLDQLRSSHPAFEANAEVFDFYRGPEFSLELPRSFPAAGAGIPLPAAISALLGLKPDDGVFPGAYAPR